VSVKFEFELLPDSMMRCELCLPNFGCPLKDTDLESSDCEFSGEDSGCLKIIQLVYKYAIQSNPEQIESYIEKDRVNPAFCGEAP
jgi:hypothetical protein